MARWQQASSQVCEAGRTRRRLRAGMCEACGWQLASPSCGACADLLVAAHPACAAELHVAFSRDGSQKDYVQHHLERNGPSVCALLAEQKGSLYVCGDAKHMAKDVHKALVALVAKHTPCSGTQAEAIVKAMQDEGRYQRDVW